MSRRQRESHAAILRGLAVLFVFCQVASTFGVMPNLLRDGLAPLLALPFFAPSLLGAFAAQVMLRPRRDELVATGVVAALLALPIFAFAAGPWALVNTACAALGLAALASLGVSALRRSGSERDEVLDVLRPAAILPAFVSLAHPMVYLTAVLWPTTYDHRMYAADWALGGPLSFTIARLTDRVPLLGPLCLLVYVCLPLALMLVHAARQKRGIRSSDALVAFVAVTVVGYVGYNIVPVTGPGYVFGSAFPLSPPDPASLGDARSVALPMPRNCMPSLHSAWALLVWWNARPLTAAARAAATAFFAITLLATVALGFHYVADLVAAFPLTLAAQAWATRVSDPQRRRVAILAGGAMTAAWIAFVTWSDAMLALPSVVLIALAVLVVGVSSWLERRVYEVRSEHEVDEPAALASAPTARGGAVALFLLGLAGWVHEAIVFHALAPVVGATPETRTLLTLGIPAAFALGLAAAARFEAVPGASTRVAAIAALALAPWSWLALKLVPSGAAGEVVSSGLLLAAVLSTPAPLLTGLAAPGLTPRTGVAWLGPLLLGAAAGALLGGYAVLPTSRSSLLPVFVYAFAAAAAVAIAMRDSAATTEDRASTTTALVPSLLATLLGGLVLAVEAHLAAAMLGDTAYARSQVAAIVCAGLGTGALLARSTSAGGGSAVWIHAGLAASIVATLPLWTSVPGYFASFRGYIDGFQVMGEFSQHEFIRLGCATFFLLPAAALTGLAVARTARWNGTGSAALALAGGAAGGAVGAFLLLPIVGSGWSLVASAGLAIGVAALSLPLLDGERRRAAVGALVLTAAVLLLVGGGFDAGRLAADSALTLRPSTAGAVRGVAESIGSVATLHERAGTDGSELHVNGLVRSRNAGDDAGVALPAGRSHALVLGVGSGASTQALLSSGFVRATVAEASAAAADLVRTSSPGRELFASDKVFLQIADGRALLQRDATKYDLILVDEPEVSGPEAAAKCTSEFYALAAARLLPGGVLRQQLTLERLSPVAMASVLASARKVFGAMGVEASGGYATLVGCVDVCPSNGSAPTGANDAANPVRIDTAGIDDLLASVAKTIDVPVESLPAGDADLFLRYQTPVSFRAVPGEMPESRTLLESFAN